MAKSASHFPCEVSKWLSYIVPESELVISFNAIEAFFHLNSNTFATNLKINSSSNYIRVEEESIYVMRLVELIRDFQENNFGKRNSMKAAEFKIRNVWEGDMLKLN